jgi:membrane-associated phospholipid phosphatase
VKAQSAWANEIMMAGYFSYYLLIPVTALTLFFRRQITDLRGMLYSVTTAFVLSYIGFVIFPVEGPRYFFAEQFSAPLEGWFFVPIVGYIIKHGAIHGGCMPSSHVAVALVVLLWTRRALPRLGTILTPIVLVLTIGTGWGRFHYLTDIVAGIIVGIAALSLTGFWQMAKSPAADMAAITKNTMRESEAVREGA